MEFPTDTRVGERIAVTCSTRSGTLPFQFEWIRNGEALLRSERMNIGTIEDASTLTLRNLRREDAGNYTCIVRNREGVDSFTATLRIKSKSKALDG